MAELSCFCGTSKKNFKFLKEGNFFDECCEKAGYDYLGNKAGEPKKETKKEEAPKMALSAYLRTKTLEELRYYASSIGVKSLNKKSKEDLVKELS